jgi:hypothetical protein
LVNEGDKLGTRFAGAIWVKAAQPVSLAKRTIFLQVEIDFVRRDADDRFDGRQLPARFKNCRRADNIRRESPDGIAIGFADKRLGSKMKNDLRLARGDGFGDRIGIPDVCNSGREKIGNAAHIEKAGLRVRSKRKAMDISANQMKPA